MENTKWVEFDCVDMDWAIKGLQDCFNSTDASLTWERADSIRIIIIPYGPAGGNPCVSVQGMSEPVAHVVHRWLARNSMSWHDDTGTLHDWTSTHDDDGRRVSDPCCDVAVGLDPDCFCDKDKDVK